MRPRIRGAAGVAAAAGAVVGAFSAACLDRPRRYGRPRRLRQRVGEGDDEPDDAESDHHGGEDDRTRIRAPIFERLAPCPLPAAGNQPDGERRDRGKEQQGQREFVPLRRLRRRAGGAARRLRPLRRAHQPCDQEGQHADDGDNDHGLDEDCRSLFQGRPDLSLSPRRIAYRPLRRSVSTHFCKAVVRRALQQLTERAALAACRRRAFTHGRAIGAQLPDDLDRVAIGAVAHDLEAPGVAVGFAQAAQHLRERVPLARGDRLRRRPRAWRRADRAGRLGQPRRRGLRSRRRRAAFRRGRPLAPRR